MFKLKKFKGWLPVPVLPAAQVAATSYAQQLAYLEWYVDYLASIIGNAQDVNDKVTTLTPDVTDEQYPSAKAVQDKLTIIATTLQTLSGAVADIPQIRVNRPLAGTENPLTALEYDGTNYKVIGDGQQVAVPTQVTVDAGKLYISYKDLPANAVIDSIDVLLRVSGGTVAQVRTLMPSDEILLGTMVSTDQSGGNGYCIWNTSTSTAGGTTIMTCEINSNTLWTTPLTSSDNGFADNSRIYYHIEG